MNLHQRLYEKLRGRQVSGNLRALPDDGYGTDFLSNDYLGLARSAALKNRIETAWRSMKSLMNGSTGSRLLSGNTTYAAELEVFLAGLFNAEAALLFNSGYVANLALLASVPQRGDTIILDELAHACMKEGARLSYAEKLSFRHNNLEDLEKKMRKAKGLCFVVVESVYSMDGDQCPLTQLIALCEQNGAYLIIDEAHSTGVMGEGGSGLACSLKLEDRIFARVYTFGKAMGVHGAVVVGR